MNRAFCTATILIALASSRMFSAETNAIPGYKDTPMLPGGKWHVHDPDRPQPVPVTPGTFTSQKQPGKPPSDAIVLFNGKDLSQWRDKDGNSAGWKVKGGEMTVGKGDIITRQEFGDIQLHVEFCEPPLVLTNKSQDRGNSGVFLMGRFEVQVLDCFNNLTYPDGTTGALYGQYPPLVNACRPPGEWQTYDIIFTAPRFGSDGALKSPAYATVIQNGILVQNHSALLGPTEHRKLAAYTPMPATGPIALQDHHHPVRYRNIWVRPLKNESDTQ